MSEPSTEPQAASKPKTKAPKLVFVENRTERMVMLHRRLPTGAIESTTVGRGLDLVREDYLDATADGLQILGLERVDPCKVMDVARQLQRSTSRRALHEWLKIERRENVRDQIKARLDQRAAPAPEDAED